MGVADKVDEAAARLHLNFPIRPHECPHRGLKVMESSAAGIVASGIFPWPHPNRIGGWEGTIDSRIHVWSAKKKGDVGHNQQTT